MPVILLSQRKLLKTSCIPYSGLGSTIHVIKADLSCETVLLINDLFLSFMYKYEITLERVQFKVAEQPFARAAGTYN
jgi:hypothetical protein